MRCITTVLFILLFIKISVAPCIPEEQQYDQLLSWQEEHSKRQLRAKLDTADFTQELLYQALVLYVDNPDIVFAQAKLESGWFTHPRFTKYNNCLGMKPARTREHLQSGVWKKHATYDSWIDCVKDQAMWQQYWKSRGKQMDNYYQFLQDLPYATAKHYVRTLKLMEV